MSSCLKIEVILLISFMLATCVVCDSNIEEVEYDQSQKRLDVKCSGGSDCKMKHAKCKNDVCTCDDKFYPKAPNRQICVDIPQDERTILELQEKRTLKTKCGKLQPGTTCPKFSTCWRDSTCLCEDGYIHAEDEISCIAGATSTTISVLPVVISTILYFVFK